MEYPVHKFKLIDIQKYKIVVNTRILYQDFEQDIIDYVNAHGDPEAMRRVEVEQRHEELREEIRNLKEKLTKRELRLIDSFIDFNRWEQLKQYDEFYK
jgi:hypothetical protein